MSEEVYIDDAARTTPIGGSMPSGRSRRIDSPQRIQ